MWVARLSAGPGGAAAAARGGCLLGLVAYGLLLHWIAPALWWTTPWAPLALVLVVGLLAGLASAMGWALHRMVHGARAPLWLALPVAWTAMEWLQGALPGPLAFPWLGLGTSLTAYPELVGIAELVGARGVSFWLAMVSGVLATGLVSPGPARARTALVVAVLVVLPAGWGVWRAGTLRVEPVARAAVVASDIPAGVRRDTTAWRRRTDAVLSAALAAVSAEARGARPDVPPVDLLVLPEGFAMVGPEGVGASPMVGRLRATAAAGRMSVVLGAYVDGGLGTVPANLALLVGGSEVDPTPYRKRRPVPFVEWRPGDGPPRDGARDGTGTGRVLGDDGRVLGPLICWEAIFPEAARAARLAGAEILVNLSNDAWFGESGGLGRVGRDQHAAHLVMRAVEHRMGAVRSANGGASYIVDPSGRVTVRLAPGDAAAVAMGVVRSTRRPTLYTRTGDLAGLGSMLLAVGLLVAVRLRGSSPGEPPLRGEGGRLGGSLDPRRPWR